MREIEFRAKKTENGKWVYGYYHKLNESFENKDCILEHHRNTSTIIDITTVGQYTGLIDKNGKKIFEGDIHHNYDTHSKKDRWYIVCYGEFHDTVYNFDGYGWYFVEINGDDTESFEGNEQDYVNIVGNIYDNPELIEKVEG